MVMNGSGFQSMVLHMDDKYISRFALSVWVEGYGLNTHAPHTRLSALPTERRSMRRSA